MPHIIYGVIQATNRCRSATAIKHKIYINHYENAFLSFVWLVWVSVCLFVVVFWRIFCCCFWGGGGGGYECIKKL